MSSLPTISHFSSPVTSQLNKKPKTKKQPPQTKPREYFSISYDKNGLPIVSTLVDKDPYNLKERYYELMRE